MSLIPDNFKLKVLFGLVGFVVISSILTIRHRDANLPVVYHIDSDMSLGDTSNITGSQMTSVATTSSTSTPKGVYEVYSESRVTKAVGSRVVLFFNASWDPSCQSVDKELSLSRIPDGLTILSVDYDSYLTLRKKYNVTSEHTFVEVDAQGDLLRKWIGESLENIIEQLNLIK